MDKLVALSISLLFLVSLGLMVYSMCSLDMLFHYSNPYEADFISLALRQMFYMLLIVMLLLLLLVVIEVIWIEWLLAGA